MLAILGLVSVGLLIASLVDTDSGSSEGGGSAEGLSFSQADDEVIDQVYRPDVESNLLDLVNEGELSQGQAQEDLAEIDFVSGAQNISTGGGDDAILLGAGNDQIDAGADDDTVFGGAGDDEVDLGTGDDFYGTDTRAIVSEDDFQPFPEIEIGTDSSPALSESFLEGGDDRVFGGSGNDGISDSFGANFIHGQQGDDFIVTVDDPSDAVTPDRVKGGFGKDTIIVDEGDSVETGRGFDTVTVDVFAGVEDGYQVVTIDDFEKGKDTLEIEGDTRLLRGATPAGPEDTITNPISVAALADGSGSLVSINGIAVVVVKGPTDLTLADIVLST